MKQTMQKMRMMIPTMTPNRELETSKKRPQTHARNHEPANPRTPAPHAAAPTTRRHAGGETRPTRSSPTLHAPPSQRSLAGSRQNAGSSAFQTWVAHDRRKSRPLATSAVENPRSISGETRSEAPLSGALAEEHEDNEEINGYGQNRRLGKVWRPHDGSGDHRKRLTARL
ncbi:hypothetical protein Bca4012_101274 [Brassica carinata]